MPTATRAPTPAGLHQLARLYGVRTAYVDQEGRRQGGAPEVLLRVLQELGAPVATMGDVRRAEQVRREELWRRGVEPVTVSWHGGRAEAELRRSADAADQPVRCVLELETGVSRSWIAE